MVKWLRGWMMRRRLRRVRELVPLVFGQDREKRRAAQEELARIRGVDVDTMMRELKAIKREARQKVDEREREESRNRAVIELVEQQVERLEWLVKAGKLPHMTEADVERVVDAMMEQAERRVEGGRSDE